MNKICISCKQIKNNLRTRYPFNDEQLICSDCIADDEQIDRSELLNLETVERIRNGEEVTLNIAKKIIKSLINSKLVDDKLFEEVSEYFTSLSNGGVYRMLMSLFDEEKLFIEKRMRNKILNNMFEHYNAKTEEVLLGSVDKIKEKLEWLQSPIGLIYRDLIDRRFFFLISLKFQRRFLYHIEPAQSQYLHPFTTENIVKGNPCFIRVRNGCKEQLQSFQGFLFFYNSKYYCKYDEQKYAVDEKLFNGLGKVFSLDGEMLDGEMFSLKDSIQIQSLEITCQCKSKCCQYADCGILTKQYDDLLLLIPCKLSILYDGQPIDLFTFIGRQGAILADQIDSSDCSEDNFPDFSDSDD